MNRNAQRAAVEMLDAIRALQRSGAVVMKGSEFPTGYAVRHDQGNTLITQTALDLMHTLDLLEPDEPIRLKPDYAEIMANAISKRGSV